MTTSCVACGRPIETGDYRLVGVELGTWESRYAHRGTCEVEARERYAPKRVIKKARRAKSSAPEVEELTMDEPPDPFPDDSELPWFGTERRR